MRAEEIAANASISDLRGIEGWLNGEETSIALELAKGNVVLIDFWTYTCVNCIRTLPFLIEWQEKYGDRGLTIIGVHSPEFEFEKIRANVADAIEQYGIEWLVAQDNEFSTWRAFNNRYWPAKYLIGPEMSVLYQHFGEGDYLETEQEIREALEAAGWDLSGIEEGTYRRGAPARPRVAGPDPRTLRRHPPQLRPHPVRRAARVLPRRGRRAGVHRHRGGRQRPGGQQVVPAGPLAQRP